MTNNDFIYHVTNDLILTDIIEEKDLILLCCFKKQLVKNILLKKLREHKEKTGKKNGYIQNTFSKIKMFARYA